MSNKIRNTTYYLEIKNNEINQTELSEKIHQTLKDYPKDVIKRINVTCTTNKNVWMISIIIGHYKPIKEVLKQLKTMYENTKVKVYHNKKLEIKNILL